MAYLTEAGTHVPPTRRNGELWPFALLTGDDTVYTDTLTDLVSYFIPGYADIPHDSRGQQEAFVARVDYGAGVATHTQALVLASAVTSGEFNPATASEDALTALLQTRGTALFTPKLFDGVWSYDVPLVLLSTDFAPFTSVQIFDGNVMVFDPSDERTFIDSLCVLGLAELFVGR
jgi:hypothetical protein